MQELIKINELTIILQFTNDMVLNTKKNFTYHDLPMKVGIFARYCCYFEAPISKNLG